MNWYLLIALVLLLGVLIAWDQWPRKSRKPDDDPYEHEPPHDDRWGGF
jgi:hypothetical protein